MQKLMQISVINLQLFHKNIKRGVRKKLTPHFLHFFQFSSVVIAPNKNNGNNDNENCYPSVSSAVVTAGVAVVAATIVTAAVIVK